jgi:transcriptional regulator with XRE-family HTH domain
MKKISNKRKMNTDLLSKAIGKVVTEYRKSKNLSINTFAHENDFSKATIGRIEKGNYQIGVSYLWQLAEAMNIDLPKLIKRISKKLPNDFKFIDE